jgi:hypothetical protein
VYYSCSGWGKACRMCSCLRHTLLSLTLYGGSVFSEFSHIFSGREVIPWGQTFTIFLIKYIQHVWRKQGKTIAKGCRHQGVRRLNLTASEETCFYKDTGRYSYIKLAIANSKAQNVKCLYYCKLYEIWASCG